ncbi:MAG: MiaB/RimO family radical SAM methylthiotransferase [Syntrophobacterales bacterium]|jgi:threonylcarbamoyladenosine tRNA methylthiotransferase MtaB|nr:MiaB/RimO family radical SAM methylthiotransferase [Syntrophobacterales bacterium]
MKFFVHTTGCKANQWDSHVIMNRLQEAGLSPDSLAEADVIVVNACALTEGAERDTRRFIGGLREKNGTARIILTGCHGQIYPENSFGADTVLGQGEKFKIGEYLYKKGRFVAEATAIPMDAFGVPEPRADKTRFFFKIQDGCDHFCSYCVVPSARGKPRSRPLPEVMEALKILRKRGVKEVVLTGIEVSSYLDQTTGTDFKGLLRLIDEIETPPRIRLSSVDPLYLDDEFAEILAGSAKIAKSLHIPLQSGSDKVLREMGRNYTAGYIRTVVELLLAAVDGIGIGMDVIAGFPGEGEQEFADTVRLIETLDVYYLHVFPFSARLGTRAFAMECKVPTEVKKRRVSVLKKLDAAKRRRFCLRFIGSEAWIIPEGKIYKGNFMRGYTDNYLPVYLRWNKNIENSLIRVKIREIQGDMLIGEVVGNP